MKAWPREKGRDIWRGEVDEKDSWLCAIMNCTLESDTEKQDHASTDTQQNIKPNVMPYAESIAIRH